MTAIQAELANIVTSAEIQWDELSLFTRRHSLMGIIANFAVHWIFIRSLGSFVVNTFHSEDVTMEPEKLLNKILKEVQTNNLDLKSFAILKEKLFFNCLNNSGLKFVLLILIGYIIAFPLIGFKLASNQVTIFIPP